MAEISSTSVFKLIPINRIRPSRHQARKVFNEDSIKSLARSIEVEGLEEAIGVRLVPPPGTLPEGIVSPDGEWYELIFGERRLRAHQLLGKESIEAKIIEVPNEAAAAAKGLVENLQKDDINPMDEAEGFDHLNKLDPGYWTHDRMADVVGGGRARSYITLSIGMLKLPSGVQDNVRRRTLSRSHAIELCRLPSSDLQEKAAKIIISRDLNREATRTLVDKMTGQKKEAKAGKKAGGSRGLGFEFANNDGLVRIVGNYPAGISGEDLAQELLKAYGAWGGKGK
jgi:ParB family chromosome partitioning protein